MGLYSWIDCVTNHPIYERWRDACLLVPKEYGGGNYSGCYNMYGSIGGVDIYEAVASWNRSWFRDHPGFLNFHGKRIGDRPWYRDYVDPAISPDDFEEKYFEWREVGIWISCYDSDNARLPYPIKLTHDPNAVYESAGWSVGDPGQGCSDVSVSKAEKFRRWRDSIDRAIRKTGVDIVPEPRMRYPG